MDDWQAEIDAGDAARIVARDVWGDGPASAGAIAELALRIDAASRPAFVAGPDVDASGAWESAIALVERARMDAWATPAPGGGRLGFPESHPQYRGVLAPAIGPAGQMLADYDLVVVAGSSVFPYYPYMPGPALAEGTQLVAITSDPDEAARAPAGDAIVGDLGPHADGAGRRGGQVRPRAAASARSGAALQSPARRPRSSRSSTTCCPTTA